MSTSCVLLSLVRWGSRWQLGPLFTMRYGVSLPWIVKSRSRRELVSIYANSLKYGIHLDRTIVSPFLQSGTMILAYNQGCSRLIRWCTIAWGTVALCGVCADTSMALFKRAQIPIFCLEMLWNYGAPSFMTLALLNLSHISIPVLFAANVLQKAILMVSCQKGPICHA